MIPNMQVSSPEVQMSNSRSATKSTRTGSLSGKLMSAESLSPWRKSGVTACQRHEQAGTFRERPSPNITSSAASLLGSDCWKDHRPQQYSTLQYHQVTFDSMKTMKRFCRLVVRHHHEQEAWFTPDLCRMSLVPSCCLRFPKSGASTGGSCTDLGL